MTSPSASASSDQLGGTQLIRTGGIVAGKAETIVDGAKTFRATEANTGERLEDVFTEATVDQIERSAAAAADAFEAILQWTLSQRSERLADLLSGIAEAMRVRRAEIESCCRAETGYLPQRVAGEFDRAVGQLDLFSRLARQRVWDQRQSDPADPDRPGRPKPSMVRRQVPVGPVAVFGACNFPLAISVAGNDTVAALSVGCPVIVKSHPGHPGTAQRIGQCIAAALRDSPLPPGMFSLLHGCQPETSRRLVQHPLIRAVGFTGSPQGGRALAETALARPQPIPLFAELGSTNPVFLACGAVDSRGETIASQFAASLTFGNGQMCTKPGIVAMLDRQADRWIGQVQAALRGHRPLPLLNRTVADGFDAGVQRLEATSGVTRLPTPHDAIAPQQEPAPQGTAVRQDRSEPVQTGDAFGPLHRGVHWFSVDAELALQSELLHLETFGPLSLLVRCADTDTMLRLARQFTGSLTTTLHADEADSPFQAAWLATAQRFAGRVILNGWPTGMEIGAATQHGGPYPASLDGRSTSVGYASLQRFLRPVCFQNFVPADWYDPPGT